MMIAKALALGANLAGVALPLLKPAVNGDVERVIKILQRYIDELRNAMFLVGAEDVKELRKVPLVVTGFAREWLEQRIDLWEFLRDRRL